jgi:hypothetical protein
MPVFIVSPILMAHAGDAGHVSRTGTDSGVDLDCFSFGSGARGGHATGGGSGKVSFQDLHFSKKAAAAARDADTPDLTVEMTRKAGDLVVAKDVDGGSTESVQLELAAPESFPPCGFFDGPGTDDAGDATSVPLVLAPPEGFPPCGFFDGVGMAGSDVNLF